MAGTLGENVYSVVDLPLPNLVECKDLWSRLECLVESATNGNSFVLDALREGLEKHARLEVSVVQDSCKGDARLVSAEHLLRLERDLHYSLLFAEARAHGPSVVAMKDARERVQLEELLFPQEWRLLALLLYTTVTEDAFTSERVFCAQSIWNGLLPDRKEAVRHLAFLSGFPSKNAQLEWEQRLEGFAYTLPAISDSDSILEPFTQGEIDRLITHTLADHFKPYTRPDAYIRSDAAAPVPEASFGSLLDAMAEDSDGEEFECMQRGRRAKTSATAAGRFPAPPPPPLGEERVGVVRFRRPRAEPSPPPPLLRLRSRERRPPSAPEAELAPRKRRRATAAPAKEETDSEGDAPHLKFAFQPLNGGAGCACPCGTCPSQTPGSVCPGKHPRQLAWGDGLYGCNKCALGITKGQAAPAGSKRKQSPCYLAALPFLNAH